MKYLSQIFQPLVTIPKNAKVKSTEITCISQKLLLECGLVRPTGNGFFTMLPLAQRAMDKLEALVCSSLESAGVQRISLPSLTAASLWERTGRLQECESELMQLQDRHNKGYILSPTHEEAIADLLADVGPISYKQLPLLLYQTGGKFRDERRPRHGLLRAREFRMADAYGAHASAACARAAYARLARRLRALLAALGLRALRAEAECGSMGGSVSHEWLVEAAAGEARAAACGRCARAWRGAAGPCARCGERARAVHAIEVGHTFILGTKYSEALNAHFIPAQGPPAPLIMSCYGVGLSRLLAASLEVLTRSEEGLVWPRAIAPYTTIVIGPKEGSREWAAGGWARAEAAAAAGGGDALLDDRHHLTVGKRVLQARRTGYPFIVVCGKTSLEHPPRYELLAGGAPAPVTLALPELLSALAAPADLGLDLDPDLDSDLDLKDEDIC